MSLRRWTATTVAMVMAACLLVVLGPGPDEVRRAVADPQSLLDAVGPDALLVPAAAVAAWLCWGWGVLGLLLTAASALPGAAGRVADVLLTALLPAGVRRLVAVAVGVTIGAGAPALPVGAVPSSAAEAPVAQAALAGPRAGAVDGVPPDWPGGESGAPAGDAPPATGHVVLSGECLWEIAAGRLDAGRPGRPVSDADVLAAVHAWWERNAEVIGPDPDLLLPGQVLSPPPG